MTERKFRRKRKLLERRKGLTFGGESGVLAGLGACVKRSLGNNLLERGGEGFYWGENSDSKR